MEELDLKKEYSFYIENLKARIDNNKNKTAREKSDEYIVARTKWAAELIVKYNLSIRECSRVVMISYATLSHDLAKRLASTDQKLYEKIQERKKDFKIRVLRAYELLLEGNNLTEISEIIATENGEQPVSESTISRDLTIRLEKINEEYAKIAKQIMMENSLSNLNNRKTK